MVSSFHIFCPSYENLPVINIFPLKLIFPKVKLCIAFDIEKTLEIYQTNIQLRT
jgi:hypothetical protein